MTFFQFRYLCKKYLLCRRRFRARKLDNAKKKKIDFKIL